MKRKAKALSLMSAWKHRLKLCAEGDKLWAEAVIEVHGNITMEWKSPTHCVLGTGEEFTEAALAAGRQDK